MLAVSQTVAQQVQAQRDEVGRPCREGLAVALFRAVQPAEGLLAARQAQRRAGRGQPAGRLLQRSLGLFPLPGPGQLADQHGDDGMGQKIESFPSLDMISHSREVIACRRKDLGGIDCRPAAQGDNHLWPWLAAAELAASRGKTGIVRIWLDIADETGWFSRRHGDLLDVRTECLIRVSDETIGSPGDLVFQLTEGVGAEDDLDRIPVLPMTDHSLSPFRPPRRSERSRGLCIRHRAFHKSQKKRWWSPPLTPTKAKVQKERGRSCFRRPAQV